jgi:hypothetical protein
VLALSLAAAAAPPVPPARPTPDQQRESDRALRKDSGDPAFDEEYRKWRESSRREDDAPFRERVDRILREDTRRDEGGPLPARAEPKEEPAEVKKERKPERPREEPVEAPESGTGSFNFAPVLWTILILVAAGVLAMAIYAGFTAWQQRSRKADGPEAADAPASASADGGAAPPVRREPDEWLAEARRLAAAGRWLEALRCLLFASLERLHRARLVDYERARTNRECVRAFKGPEDRRVLFGSLVDAFDGTVYGALPFGAAEYSRAEVAARELGRGVGDESGA